MKKSVDPVERQFRRVRRFFIVWPFACLFIIGSNVWSDATRSRPFNLDGLIMGVVITLWGGVIYLLARRLYRHMKKDRELFGSQR